MTIAKADIDAEFGSLRMPSKEDLVVFDGYDELDKEHALNLFHSKTQDDIYREIVSGTMAVGSAVEDLAVLSPDAFRYYLAPYLTYLCCGVDGDPNEDEGVHFFCFAFREHIRINGAAELNEGQRRLVQGALHICRDRLRGTDADADEWRDRLLADIEFLIEAFGALE